MDLKTEIVEQLLNRWNSILIKARKDNIETLALCVKSENNKKKVYTLIMDSFLDVKSFDNPSDAIALVNTYQIIGYEIIDSEIKVEDIFNSIFVENMLDK